MPPSRTDDSIFESLCNAHFQTNFSLRVDGTCRGFPAQETRSAPATVPKRELHEDEDLPLRRDTRRGRSMLRGHCTVSGLVRRRCRPGVTDPGNESVNLRIAIYDMR
jgi:hypothetical protein